MTNYNIHSYNNTATEQHETTSLLNRGRDDCCGDGATNTNSSKHGGSLGRRLKDMLFGAIVAAVVAILVVQTLHPKSEWNSNSNNNNNNNNGGNNDGNSPETATATPTTSNNAEQSQSSKSHLRPLLEETHKEEKIVSSNDATQQEQQQQLDNNTSINTDSLVSKYEKFQAFGFQIYTGGKSKRKNEKNVFYFAS